MPSTTSRWAFYREMTWSAVSNRLQMLTSPFNSESPSTVLCSSSSTPSLRAKRTVATVHPMCGLQTRYVWRAWRDCGATALTKTKTTDNACATLALLNIVMNRECIDIGEKLREFRASTMDLSPPLRGHVLSSNPFIRAIHNSFTRYAIQSPMRT